MELKFKVGDVLEHVITGEKAVVAKIVDQKMKKDPDDAKSTETETVQFYTLSAGLEKSNMYPVDTAHGCMKLVK